MADFDINTAKVIDDPNGNKYYEITEGTTIYRGAKNSVLNKDPPPFFGFFEKDVKQYGSVFEYIFNKNVKLLAIMEMDTDSDFYKNAPINIQEILKQNFGYNETKIRRSTPKSDRLIMQYLCALINGGEIEHKTIEKHKDYEHYSGYAMNGNNYTESKSKFHAELVICGHLLATVFEEDKLNAHGSAINVRGTPTEMDLE